MEDGILSLSFHIKTPQLVGIIAGCGVFLITMFVVIYLLHASGSISKLIEEFKLDSSSVQSKSGNCEFQFKNQPPIYDHLLRARHFLHGKDFIPPLRSKHIFLQKLQEGIFASSENDGYTHCPNVCGKDLIHELLLIGNGSAIFGESDYKPNRIWGWLDSLPDPANSKSTGCYPISDYEQFKKYVLHEAKISMVIWEQELLKPIGMIIISENDPKNLSICIGM